MCSEACSAINSNQGPHPVLPLRFRSPTTGSDEAWRKTYQMIAENPGCCDEAWFSTGIGVPPLEWHAENAARSATAQSASIATARGSPHFSTISAK